MKHFAGRTASDVVKSGYGVLDGGATKTMASVATIERLQNCREQDLPGITRTRADLALGRGTFGFGNTAINVFRNASRTGDELEDSCIGSRTGTCPDFSGFAEKDGCPAGLLYG